MTTDDHGSDNLDAGGGVDRIGRRELLGKGAAAVGAAGVAWAAPTIQGLSIRPDFAAAASGPCAGRHTFDLPLGDSTQFTFDSTKDFGCSPFKTHWIQTIDSDGTSDPSN